MNSSAKAAALEQTIHSIIQRHGEGAIMRLGDLPAPSEAVIPTGLPDLDAVFGIGGVPRGRIIEIHGPESAGKTALALHIARQAPNALYVDADNGLPPVGLLGATGLHLLTVDNLEDALEAVRVAAPGFDVIVIDTLAALPMREDEITDIKWKTKNPANLLSRALPILAAELANSGCTLVVVNQLRDIPGVMYGNPEEVTGGRALKFYASVRLDVRRIEVRKEKSEIVGQKVRIRCTKNKTAPPFREAVLSLWFGCPHRPAWGLQRIAKKRRTA